MTIPTLDVFDGLPILSKTQSWYVSTIIQDDAYLQQAIIYVLRNPVQAGIVDSYRKYPWSSAAAYFSKGNTDWLAAEFVQELFSSLENLSAAVRSG